MVNIIDERKERNFLFNDISKGQIFWSPTHLCFMLKVEDSGCYSAVSLSQGNVYCIKPTEIVEPCNAEITIFNY